MTLSQAFTFIAGVCGIVDVFFFIASLFWFITMYQNQKPGVPMSAMLLARPSDLTDAGLRARRKCIRNYIFFLVCFFLGPTAAILAKLFRA